MAAGNFFNNAQYAMFSAGTIMQPNQQRCNIKLGIRVRVVLKQDQKSGKLTEGIVKDILTNSPTHPHGIKVRLIDGKVWPSSNPLVILINI